MMGSIGITVGLLGYFLFFFIELLSDTKYRAVRCPVHPRKPIPCSRDPYYHHLLFLHSQLQQITCSFQTRLNSIKVNWSQAI